MSKLELLEDSQKIHAPRSLSYSEYAKQFDQMCELLPVYQDNIDYLIGLLPEMNLPQDAKVCDLGAGTGNFICALAEAIPSAHFTHVDMDPEMNARAKSKYHEVPALNVDIIEEYIERVELPDNHFDLIICVNALNTAPPQLPVLRQMRRWLRPKGTLFLIDFGRKQRVLDWGWYIFRNTLKSHGINRYLRALVENREALKQNRLAGKDQDRGVMWTHSLAEFQDLVSKAGFLIEKSGTCYRDYCDMVVAKA